MSQSGTGDIGGNGFPSTKQPQSAHPSHFYHQWPDGYNYGYNYYPVKPTNPHMASAMRSNFPMQMGYMNQMHTQYFNGQSSSNLQHQPTHNNLPQFFQHSNYGKPQMQNNVYSHMQNQQYFQYQQQQQQYYSNNCQNVNFNGTLVHQNNYQNYMVKENGCQQSSFLPNAQMGHAVKEESSAAEQLVADENCSYVVKNDTSVNSGESSFLQGSKTASLVKHCENDPYSAQSNKYAKALPRCDSTKSETTESSCSSMSTDSDNVHNQSTNYARPYAGHNQMQLQPNDSDSNNNMNYRNYMNSQNVMNKSTNAYCDPTSMPHSAENFKIRPQAPGMQYHMSSQGVRSMSMGFQTHTNNVQPYQNQVMRQPNMGHNYGMHQPTMQPVNNVRMPFPQQVKPTQMIQTGSQQTPSNTIRPTNLNSVSKVLPPPTVVPYGWKRINNSGQVEYISPSGVHLRSQVEVVEYLLQAGTCKCGLQCPMRVENTFCFDPKVPHRATVASEISSGDIKLCNHRRKLALSFTHNVQNQVKKEDGRKKRKRKTNRKDVENESNAVVPYQQGPIPQQQQPSTQPLSQQTTHNWNPQQMESQTSYGYVDGYNNSTQDQQTHFAQNQKYYQGTYGVPGCSYTQNQNSSHNYGYGVGSYNYQMPTASNVPPTESTVEKKRKKPAARPKKKQKVVHEVTQDEQAGPTFLDDPNGYMAQQTAILNNTMAGGGIGQFSPQGSQTKGNQNDVSPEVSKANLSVVPLPSNVPLPARVSKTPCDENPVQPVNTIQSVATMESSSANHIVTVTYTNSSPVSKMDTEVTVSETKTAYKPDQKSRNVCRDLDFDSNKPLTPGTFTGTSQSPLEMVQNIVSSIPVPTSPKESLSRPGSIPSHQVSQANIQPQQVVGPVFNVQNGNIPGVMYNTGVLRSTGVSLVHNNNNQMPILSTSSNVVVVTSPFTSKVPISAVPSSTSVMNVPQVHMTQQVQPMVQLVNAFTAMQTPVIIQNGSNIVHSLPNTNGVIGHSIIPSSGPFVGQSLLPPTIVDSTRQHIQVAKISPVSSDGQVDSVDRSPVGSNRSTPQSTPNSSDTPPGGRKRKRRNPSTPGSHAPIMPAIIMSKQMSQSLVMNTSQGPYNAGSLEPNGTNRNAINVVQMVSGPVAGTVPVHVPPTILVPSANPSGIIINQLPDGSFVSTDPNTGMTYPVQLQLSGSHVVGVPPNTPNSNMFATQPNPAMVVGALRSPNQAVSNKVINIASAPSNANVYIQPVESNAEYQCPPTSDVQYVSNNTVLQQKTTIVAQQTTVVATNYGTHSSVSTQTPVVLGESDVTSSDSVGDPVVSRVASTSPSHQSAEVTTTKQDEEVSSPEVPQVSPVNGKNRTPKRSVMPPMSCISDDCLMKGCVVWGLHQGQHNWPAIVLDQAGGEVVIRWFGDQMVEQIKKISLYSQPSMVTPKTRRRVRGLTALENALKELQQYSLSSKLVPTSSMTEETHDPENARRRRKLKHN